MNDPILTFLAQRENLPLALEIHRHVKRLSKTIHRTFWELIKVELEKRLLDTSQSQHWELVDHATKGYDKQDARLSLQPKASNGLFLAPTLEQGAPEEFCLYYGIKWSEAQKKLPPNMSQTLTLAETLEKHRFQRNSWWIGMNDLPWCIQKDEFLLAMANEQASLIAEIGEDFWSLFIKYEKLVIAANEELAGG
ncbi:MAG: hypothetical protein KDE56_31945 [Anaerolineales bacterium]|nr:hypothetical protein [Anaerolineales bacterium]